ncbi:MAG: hypothetical protein PVF17_10285 [Ignavibacteria bacterium]|jgi:hypothetical protein
MKSINLLFSIAFNLVLLVILTNEVIAQSTVKWGDKPETVVEIFGEPDIEGKNNALTYYYGDKTGFVVFGFDASSNELNQIIVAPEGIGTADAAALGGMVDPEKLPNLADAEGFLGEFLRSREQDEQ